MEFEPDEHFCAVLACEAVGEAFAVLVHSLNQVRGNAGVYRAVAARGDDVDAGLEFALHRQTLLDSRFRGNDEGGVGKGQTQHHCPCPASAKSSFARAIK